MGGEVFATPTCFLLRELLVEVHGERERGVMVMQQLMEMSCRDSVLV